MGLTYKENVADIRETSAKEVIKELQEYGVDIYGYDPLLGDIKAEFGIKPYDVRLAEQSVVNSSNKVDCVILALAHDAFKNITLDELKLVMNDSSSILIDVRGFFDKSEAMEGMIHHYTL
jgi:UDP-N-acetyl-D-mannosaminuronate dehydrogenase